MPFQAPKGTQDLLDTHALEWLDFIAIARDIFSTYNYKFTETPIFERHDLFDRSAGQSSDIMRKEIFAVRSMGALDAMAQNKQLKADQNLALRPEGTAGIVRAIAQNSLIQQGGAPAKLWYAGPMFRCERPQKGRLRQFHQVGVECVGATDIAADVEAICMCMHFFSELGFPKESLRLLINSMGDDNCRQPYTQKVREYMREHKGELCKECVRRIDENPLRSFDCKNENCQKVMQGAPQFEDNLCDTCKERFEQVKSYLNLLNIDYVVDPTLVRGFDYYTGCVFEIEAGDSKDNTYAIGGGGRYDKLMGEISGKDAPGIGFAVGFERVMLALQALDVSFVGKHLAPVYVASVTDSMRKQAFFIMQKLREADLQADMDMQGRSLKAQFKQAAKLDSVHVVVVGPDELADGQVKLRNMETHEEESVDIDELVDILVDEFTLAAYRGLEDVADGLIDELQRLGIQFSLNLSSSFAGCANARQYANLRIIWLVTY